MNPDQLSPQRIESAPLPDYIEMYHVSGQDIITSHSFERYLRGHKYDDEMARLVITSPYNIRYAPEEERALLIKQGLESTNPEVQKGSAMMIRYAPGEERALLIKQGLESTNPEVQKESAEIIRYAPNEGQALLREIVTQKIKQGLENSNPELQKVSAVMMRYVIPYAPEEEKALLIKQGLESANPAVQAVSAGMIWSTPKEGRSLLREIVTQKIKQGLENSNPEVQKVSAVMIYSAPEEEKALLREIVTQKIKQGLENSNPEVQKGSVLIIPYAPEEERALLIKQGLESINLEVQKVSALMIQFAPEEERALLIKQGMESAHPEVQKGSAEMIRYVPEGERALLLEQIIKAKLGNYLIESPLYDNQNVNAESFSRKNFQKTGSETILVGGKLNDKSIIRRITPSAFLAWQKIYENYQAWKDAGFDYVPIEPILSYTPNKNGLVDVHSGVLDLSLQSWTNKTSMFSAELEEQKQKILKVLTANDISHGHTHDGNFCLRFFRDENGQPDFKLTPRLYAIDFDQAVSLVESSKLVHEEELLIDI